MVACNRCGEECKDYSVFSNIKVKWYSLCSKDAVLCQSCISKMFRGLDKYV